MKIKPQTLLFLIFSIFVLDNVQAQSFTLTELSLGYGYLEMSHVQIKTNIKNSNTFIGIFAGTGGELFAKGESQCVGFEFDKSIFRSRVSRFSNFKWFIDNKITYWMLTDPYYNWSLVSYSLCLERKIYFSKSISLSAEAGTIFNVVLSSERKSFEEVGWPYHMMPSVRLSINYLLSRHE